MKFFLQTEQAKADAVLLAWTSCQCHRGGDTEGTQPQVLVCSQLELGPAIPCFYPLWPNRFGLFLNSCWSEPHKHSSGVVTKYSLWFLPGAGAAALPTSGQPLLHAQHRNLLVTPSSASWENSWAALAVWAARAGNAALCGTGEMWE